MRPGEEARRVIDACLAMGFARAGVARARATSWREHVLAWLAEGKHGEMTYMTELLDERLDVTRLLVGARSVIMVADQYASGAAAERREALVGSVARYARGADYHVEIKRRLHELADRLRALHPGAEFRTFVDSGPAMEREHAVRAGLGFVGKHTLLISPGASGEGGGSWMLLGGVATTLDLCEAEEHANERRVIGCGTCSKCIDACPTGAIGEYTVDARRCVSYLTLEHQGLIAQELHRGMGDMLLGCDVCQEVCPFNQGEDSAGARVNPAYADRGRAGLAILDVLGWTEDDRRRALAGSAAKRASLEMIRRNAVIAAGNVAVNQASVRARVREALAKIAADGAESEIVSATARQTLERLGNG